MSATVADVMTSRVIAVKRSALYRSGEPAPSELVSCANSSSRDASRAVRPCPVVYQLGDTVLG
jgi:hypothetical protein